jgi:hypothetical protein
VSQWLTKVTEVLGGGGAPEPVAVTLRRAGRQRAKVVIEQASPEGGDRSLMLSTTVELVREHDVVIAMPTIGGLTRQLATGERLTIVLDARRGRVRGSTQCLGRIKLPSGGEGKFFGYRLSLPTHFQAVSHEQQPLLPLGFELVQDVELHTKRTQYLAPIRGTITELHLTGMKITSRNATDRVTPGERAYLKATMPEPVDELNEMVVVTEVALGREAGELIIQVQFERQIERIEEVVRASTSRASHRRIGP